MDPPDILHVPAVVHGRCLLSRPAGGAPEALLVGFHGYGELADDALAALPPLAIGKPWALAAVQALHPFYRRSDGAVIAGWMTRQDRTLAIADNLAYVHRALSTLLAELPSVQRVAVVGFSQGVAMAYRGVARSGFPCHAVVALAGDVPPELGDTDLAGLPPVLVGRGSDDDWYTAEKMERDLAVLGAAGVAVEGCVFEGGHEWGVEFVDVARQFLAERLAERLAAE